MTEDPIQVCPDCNGKVKRLIGAGAGLIFKGSGFYATDHRSSSFADSGDGKDGVESGSSASDGGSGDGNGAGSEAGAKAKKAPSESKAAD